jgi:hypothetical protein
MRGYYGIYGIQRAFLADIQQERYKSSGKRGDDPKIS